jgi:hypothetical protein
MAVDRSNGLVDQELGRMTEPRAVRLAHDEMPVTLNVTKQEQGQWKLRKELAKWQKIGHDLPEKHEPLMPPVRVVVRHYRSHRGAMPDTGAPILAVKAPIDGVVEAGLLPNDKPETVRKLTFLAPEVTGKHGLGVVFVELPVDGRLAV